MITEIRDQSEPMLSTHAIGTMNPGQLFKLDEGKANGINMLLGHEELSAVSRYVCLRNTLEGCLHPATQVYKYKGKLTVERE